MAGAAAIEIELTEYERAELTRWTRRRKTSQSKATQACIVLAGADGLNNAQICETLGVCRSTVHTARQRFAERRFEELDDEPVRGARRQDGRRVQPVPSEAPRPGVHPVHEHGGRGGPRDGRSTGRVGAWARTA